MKKYWYLGIPLVLVMCAVLLNAGSSAKTVNINTELFNLELVNYEKSLNGSIMMSLAVSDKGRKYNSELISINTEGKLLFNRSFYNDSQEVLPKDFKKNSNGIFSYFLNYSIENRNFATIHFLNKDYVDLFLSISTLLDSSMASNDVYFADNGNIFLLFFKKKLINNSLDIELQEWNTRGENVFFWSASNYLNLNDYNIQKNKRNAFEINSIAKGEPGEIYISFSKLNEILILSYPDGKVLANISSNKWRFLNDSLNGFKSQKSVKYLGNNRILLFDDGNNDRNVSRAVEYEIDVHKKTAKLIWEFRDSLHRKYIDDCGSVQRLSNGNTLIGWGNTDKVESRLVNRHVVFTEVNKGGKIIRELFSKNEVASYRVHFEESK